MNFKLSVVSLLLVLDNISFANTQNLPKYLEHGCNFVATPKRGFYCVKFSYNDVDCFPWKKNNCNAIYINPKVCSDWTCPVNLFLKLNIKFLINLTCKL